MNYTQIYKSLLEKQNRIRLELFQVEFKIAAREKLSRDPSFAYCSAELKSFRDIRSTLTNWLHKSNKLVNSIRRKKFLDLPSAEQSLIKEGYEFRGYTNMATAKNELELCNASKHFLRFRSSISVYSSDLDICDSCKCYYKTIAD